MSDIKDPITTAFEKLLDDEIEPLRKAIRETGHRIDKLMAGDTPSTFKPIVPLEKVNGTHTLETTP